jgi:hypothetical protein
VREEKSINPNFFYGKVWGCVDVLWGFWDFLTFFWGVFKFLRAGDEMGLGW